MVNVRHITKGGEEWTFVSYKFDWERLVAYKTAEAMLTLTLITKYVSLNEHKIK